MKKFIPLAAIAIIMAACSSDIQPPNSFSQEEKAVKLLKQFRRSVHTNTRGNDDITIIEIQRKRYVFNDDSVIEVPPTRIMDPDTSLSEEVIPNEFYISQVIFAEGSHTGYSFICDDERINKVLFYTESGTPSDTIYNAPLKKTIEMYPTIISNLLRNGFQLYAYGETTLGTTPNIVNNIMRFKWTQSYPYNMFAPPTTWNNPSEQSLYKNKCPIGCVTVATAQLIAHCGHFRGTFYGNGHLDLSTMLSQYNYYSADSIKIGQFMHEVALNCNIKFNSNSAGSTIKCASKYLLDQGYNCQYQSSLDLDRLMVNINHGYPQMISGFGDESGHAWLITGYRRELKWCDFYCNWGWGGYSDGWSISNPYTTDSGTTYGNNVNYVYIDGYLN